MNYKTIILFISLTFPLFAFSQVKEAKDDKQSFAFAQRDFGKYFISDHYAPNVRINTGIGLNLADYNIDRSRDGKYVLYNETVIGGDIPLYIKKWKNNSISFSIPLSFSVWFDFTEDLTAPILNTDYRFALMEINYLREVNKGFIKNYAIKFIPFFHESTHIGDELTIARMLSNAGIVRVNVSYEITELAFTINDAMSKKELNHSFMAGARILLNPDKGWYSFSRYEGDTTLVDPSERWVEPYLRYQFQNPEGFLSFKKTMFVLSTDLSFRVKYGYPFYYDEDGSINEVTIDEQYRPSLNILLGWKFLNSKNELSHFGAYLRMYQGINYHGQFRNIPKYQFYGLSFIYEH